MQNLQVNLDDSIVSIDYIEYFVIGVQAMIWLIGIVAYTLNIPVKFILSAPLILLLPLLAFSYIVGIVFDSCAQFILSPLRTAIKGQQLGRTSPTDELIGYYAPALYRTYEWRIRRTRIPGSAWLSWLLIGVAVILQNGWSYSFMDWALVVIVIIASLLTLFSWYLLMRRAYRFRKNAIDIIQQQRQSVDVHAEAEENLVVLRHDVDQIGTPSAQ